MLAGLECSQQRKLAEKIILQQWNVRRLESEIQKLEKNLQKSQDLKIPILKNYKVLFLNLSVVL